MLSTISNLAYTCCTRGTLDEDDPLVWCRDLMAHSCGDFSFAVAQANGEIEDHSQIEIGSNAIFVGIYDGHGGAHVAKYVNNNLFHHAIAFARQDGTFSEETLRRAVQATENGFLNIVRSTQDLKPEIKSTGSCCLIGVIFKRTLLIASLGDSRAVIGHINQDLRRMLAVPLTTDHNADNMHIRHALREAHPDDPSILVNDNGIWRVKGILQITRAIGDAYMKDAEFAVGHPSGHPSLQQFRLPTPVKRPAISAQPDLRTRELSADDRFIIFASDGLWDNLTNQEAVDIVNRNPRSGIARRLLKASQKVAAHRRGISYQELQRIPRGDRRDSHDDITVVVVFIDHDSLGQKVPNMVTRSIKGYNDAVNESEFAIIDELM